jgi:hypothetical protein
LQSNITSRSESVDTSSAKFTLRGGRIVEILPYTINAMERLTVSGALNALGGDDLPLRFKAMRDLVFEAIVENTDLDPARVGDLVDATQFSQLLDVITQVNGWKRKDPGEVQGSPN